MIERLIIEQGGLSITSQVVFVAFDAGASDRRKMEPAFSYNLSFDFLMAAEAFGANDFLPHIMALGAVLSAFKVLVRAG